MGCEFNFEILHATNDADALQEVSAMIDQAKYEYGHSGYSGTFAEARGCEINKSVIFEGITDAEDWLDEHAEKWGPAIIVLTQSGKYCVGANCSS
jgi:hypothetical protein